APAPPLPPNSKFPVAYKKSPPAPQSPSSIPLAKRAPAAPPPRYKRKAPRAAEPSPTCAVIATDSPTNTESTPAPPHAIPPPPARETRLSSENPPTPPDPQNSGLPTAS